MYNRSGAEFLLSILTWNCDLFLSSHHNSVKPLAHNRGLMDSIVWTTGSAVSSLSGFLERKKQTCLITRVVLSGEWNLIATRVILKKPAIKGPCVQIQADQLFPNIAEAYSETSALSYTREKERERELERELNIVGRERETDGEKGWQIASVWGRRGEGLVKVSCPVGNCVYCTVCGNFACSYLIKGH